MNILVNHEKKISAISGILLLLVAFLLSYEPWQLGLCELVRNEGFYAAVTSEISWSMPIAKAHGLPVLGAYPFYPLISSFIEDISGLSVEFSMRLTAVFMTFITAIIIYIATKLSLNRVSAQVATAIFISCNIVVEKSLDAYPTSFIALGLLSAQLLWFYFGVRKANWNLAWIISLTIMALTFYAGGGLAIILFFFPLFLMRRPLTIWTKLNKTGLYLGVIILIFAIVLWGLPYLKDMQNISPFSINRWQSVTLLSWLEQVIQFPFYLIIRFLPWSLLTWIPFCEALQKSDPMPIYSRYLRIIVISNSFLLWILPERQSHEILYLAGPLAILTGLYYQNAVRRYSKQIRLLLTSCGFFTLTLAVAILLFCFLPEDIIRHSAISISNSIDFRFDTDYRIWAGGTVLLTLIACWFLFRCDRRSPVWVLLLVTAVSGALFYWMVIAPYRAQDRRAIEFGNLLRTALQGAEKDNMPTVIYKSNIVDLYAECRYLGVGVQQIMNLKDLPENEDVVYLLTTEFPIYPQRNWTNLLAPNNTYKQKKVMLWQGKLRENKNVNPQSDW